MNRFLLTLTTVGAIAAASVPASAQTGRIDPGLSGETGSITQVQYREGQRFRHGGGWNRGGGWRGGYGGYRHRNRGYGYGIGAGVAGLAAGALIGGAIASQAAPVYAAPVYGAPVADDGGVGYCLNRYKSYDPASGTYLGYDGLRHPCP